MNSTNGGAIVPAGVEAREGFGERSLAKSAETASTAVAAQARAAIEARYVMALQRPRGFMDVRDKVLKACKRPGFARSAIYSKPVGGQSVRGLSVRFAEEAARCMGNLLIESPVIFDDAEKQIVKVSVTDLESNTGYSEEITIEKTVERRQLRGDQKPIASRTNSTGQTVYIVQATDDDILNKRNALKSKAIRNGVLRILPSDITEEARDLCDETARNRTAQDPDAERKWIADNFRVFGVTPAHIAEYLGHDLGSATADELVKLREIGVAIDSNETTWSDVIGRKAADAEKAQASAKKSDLAEALKKKQTQTAKAGQQRIVADADDPPEPGAGG